HRFFIVRDEAELRLFAKITYHIRETLNIGVINRCIDFIEHAEGGRLDQVNSKEQGNGCEGFVAAGQLVDSGGAFALEVGLYFDARIQRILRLFVDDQITVIIIIKESMKYFMKVQSDLLESFVETLCSRLVDLIDCLTQLFGSLLKIAHLFFIKVEPLLLLFILLNSQRVDFTNFFKLLFERGNALFGSLRINIFRQLGIDLIHQNAVGLPDMIGETFDLHLKLFSGHGQMMDQLHIDLLAAAHLLYLFLHLVDTSSLLCGCFFCLFYLLLILV